MRRTKTLFLICCISLAGIMGYAQSPVVIYSGASLPTEQGWNEWKLDATVNSVAAPVTQVAGSGVLKLTSSNAANQFSQLGWYKTGLGFDLSKGYTIEIKAKLTVAGKGAFNIQGYDNEGKGFRVGISETQLTNQSNPLDATTVIKDDLTNDNAFHIYRLAVAPSGLVTVYRDSQSVGTFQMGFFQFDNIIENGGFEDGDTGDLTNASYFPDFLTQNGSLYLTDDPKNKRTGNFALVLDNNGNGDHNWSETMERTYTRDLAVKPNTPYEISITRRRTQVEPWCYRDMGAFYNDQDGTLGLLGNNRDGRDDDGRPMWGGFDRMWQVHNESFTTPADKQSIRFEFPTWTRNGNTNTTSLDNFIFRERHSDLTIGVTTEPAHAIIDPVFHEGYVNLIQNGDFEDVTLNNDGTPYTWILASEGGENTNEPVGFNPVWGGDVRIQNQNKPDDFNMGDEPYAHSGTNAVRFSSLDNNARNIDFHIELEANKTYRFVFWHRNPKWPDWCWFFVRIGEQEPIWGHHMGDRANKWIPVDLTFTTSETDKTLHLYSTSESHGGWYNQYFDDFTLYEIPDGTPLDPQIVGKTNLIANGDFEDETLNNDGTPYAWALSNPSNNDDAFPMAYNELWGNWVRLQDKEQRGPNYWGDRDDTGYQWAHSGTHSMRFTYMDNWDAARDYEYGVLLGQTGYPGDILPGAYQANLNFKKELEPNKTYTFVFWIKTSVWNDVGTIAVYNGDIRVWDQRFTNKWMNWSRQTITFSTTEANHTFRFVTEFGGWFNFYLDDLFLYEEDAYVPYEANGDSYLFFGKSQNTASADVEVEYVKAYSSGAYAPGEEMFTITYNADGGTGAANNTYEAEGTEAITLPIPLKDGYTFGGWFDNSEFTGEAVTEIPAGSIGNKAFYAKWDVIVYSIIYHLNEGTGAENSTYTIESETITLPVPTRAGYDFLGWFISDRFSGVAVTEIAHGSTGNKNFYAKWELSNGIKGLDVEALCVYPNPVTDGKLTLVNLSNGGKVEIRNVIGTLAGVYEVTDRTMTIDLSAIPAGTYIVKANGQIAKILKK